ncbi:poly-gamma-glutamate biosynthesis protein PgsC [Leptospira fluminis]|uniref:Poly-gamma-glutamate biosynthesis protein PgsC n=1 Tax=Leptospira fluminis TaxID=2484979 RepID=A0A4R9GPW4_9LEPT|nr:poly-gamma-glutamate biosynthesis protein PgsC [Leptospira fluminis]TGK19259.1 poly-gamma-glutamate biosynthesis protein PgsC [Leptospira fluminis]
MDLLTLAIGIGLFVSLAFAEFFGIAAGGLVVPGYIALQLHRPLNILMTLSLGGLTFGFGRLVSGVTILYGKRKTAFLLLTGFLLGALVQEFLHRNHLVFSAFSPTLSDSEEARVVGHIIPGLIALWMDRQGIWETICVLLTGSVIVRLALIVILGGDFQP